MKSTVGKDLPHKLVSGTGYFKDKSDQQVYMNPYAPEQFFCTPTGIRLLDRVFYWLRGRWGL